MKTKIDQSGRVVIPKPIRDGLQLHNGSELDVEIQDGNISLVPVEKKPHLIRKGKVLVYTGKLPPDKVDYQNSDREGRSQIILPQIDMQ